MTDSYSRPFLVYLVGTAVICGALIMVLEVLGSRVVGPFFGVSLFVWTSLITVTLVALAAGYALGGVMSDKKESPDYLYGIILLAGFLVLLIPLIKGPVLKAFPPLGLRSGAFLSASVLFGPSLLLLGCVSPYLVKLAVRETKKIGRIVGVFYALSTVGSFVGTVLNHRGGPVPVRHGAHQGLRRGAGPGGGHQPLLCAGGHARRLRLDDIAPRPEDLEHLIETVGPAAVGARRGPLTRRFRRRQADKETG